MTKLILNLESTIFMLSMLGGFVSFVCCYIMYRANRRLRLRNPFRFNIKHPGNSAEQITTPADKKSDTQQSMIQALFDTIENELYDQPNGKPSYRIILNGDRYDQETINGVILKYKLAGWGLVEITNENSGLLCILSV